ncbi:MAG TPA: M55 family metallopeptidase [Candidatus Dormibacteraeota bacterium]|nr:M55 family metallopeptidase [Candidatus Dormibacteraeota bacterium]
MSIDMEGVAGVVARDQVVADRGDAYRRSCALMTREANAAVSGAAAAGAQRIVVNDSHGRMANLDPELLDRRAECSIGFPKPYSMMAGIGAHFAAVMFVGYHAGAGSSPAILDHTYSPAVFRAVRVNGVRQTEATLNAALAGHHGVPVALVTGDEAACDEARAVLGQDVPTVVTKAALGAEAAFCLHPALSRERIEAGAREGLQRLAAGRLQPYVVPGPYTLECDITTTLAADYCETIPGVERPAGRTMRFEHDDYPTVFRCLLAMGLIGGLSGVS